MVDPEVESERASSIRIAPIDDANLTQVIDFANTVRSRPLSRQYLKWRYRDCPIMEGSAAMAGDQCVATLFVLKRQYQTPDGPRECLEPFEWHANEDWRAQAPGLRLIRHYMKGPRPIVAVSGTAVAAGLLTRLRWQTRGFAHRYYLPLTGRYVRTRGRNAAIATAFDLIGRPFVMPRASRRSPLSLVPASNYAEALGDLVARQSRFGLMRQPDGAMMTWLHSAPPSVGTWTVLHARVGDELAGWVLTRVFSNEGLRVGELLEVFLDDRHRRYYPDLIAAAYATLRGYEPDMLLASTTCPDTAAGLQQLRFRRDVECPVFVWWGKNAAPEGTVLIDGAIADHSFFPLLSAKEVAWMAPAKS